MQKQAMAAKKKQTWDGTEVPGLVSVNEITLEKSTIEVPEFKKIRQLQSDITKIPAIEYKYKTDRNTNTLKFFEDWYFNNEVKDGTLIETDAHGSEYARKLLPQCELLKITYAGYDAASPVYANVTVTVLPYDIIPIKAE